MNSMPPAVQAFLRAHEHGHVYQIVYNPAMLYGSYAEYDADCYAAAVLSYRDRGALTGAVQWFERVMGPYGGDATHGNGFQMAQRARQCAAQSGFSVPQAPVPNPESQGDAGLARNGGPSEAQDVAAAQEPANLALLASAVSHGPDDIPDRGAPSVCTTVELIKDAAHQAFWEISDHTGAVRTDISRGLDADCSIDGSRGAVTCQFKESVNASLLKARLPACFDSHDWVKQCVDGKCTSQKFEHMKDGAHHVVVEASFGDVRRIVFRSPVAERHDHDFKKAGSAFDSDKSRRD
jgi:hypothetical protein